MLPSSPQGTTSLPHIGAWCLGASASHRLSPARSGGPEHGAPLLREVPKQPSCYLKVEGSSHSSHRDGSLQRSWTTLAPGRRLSWLGARLLEHPKPPTAGSSSLSGWGVSFSAPHVRDHWCSVCSGQGGALENCGPSDQWPQLLSNTAASGCAEQSWLSDTSSGKKAGLLMKNWVNNAVEVRETKRDMQMSYWLLMGWFSFRSIWAFCEAKLEKQYIKRRIC